MAKRVIYSDKVRCYDCTVFRAIPVGGRFRFSSEVEGYATKRGVLEKTSVRGWKYIDDGQTGTVGSIDVVVLRVDDDGDIIRVSDYTPSVRD